MSYNKSKKKKKNSMFIFFFLFLFFLIQQFSARSAGAAFVKFYDLQSVFFPVTCIPVHRQSSTAIWPVIPYLYSTMASSRLDQVITSKKSHEIHFFRKKCVFLLLIIQKLVYLFYYYFFFFWKLCWFVSIQQWRIVKLSSDLFISFYVNW